MALKKSLLGLSLFAALMTASGVASAERVIRFGTDATYPPFQYTSPSGEIIGLDIELAQAMCERMQAKCTFQNQAWDGIIPALKAKKFDVINSSMSITPERQKAVSFTQPMRSIPNPLIGKEGLKAEPTPEGTKDLDLGVQQGTIQDKYASKYFKDAKIKRYKSYEDAIRDLLTGRLQAIFTDSAVADSFLNGPHGKGYAIIGKPIPPSADRAIFGQGPGFAVRKEDKQLLDDLNRAFEQVRDDGTYEKIAKKYFKYKIFE